MLWLGLACVYLSGGLGAWARGLSGLNHPTKVDFICAKQTLPDQRDRVGEDKVSLFWLEPSEVRREEGVVRSGRESGRTSTVFSHGNGVRTWDWDRQASGPESKHEQWCHEHTNAT